MLNNYFTEVQTDIQRKRAIAVNAALELIKATLSDANDGNSVDHQLFAAEKHISTLADAIEEALKV